MAYKLKTALGNAIYGAHKCTVDPVIDIIKEVLGFRQFSLRGTAAAGEWCLVCSQALPYLIRGVMGNRSTFPDHSVTISDSLLSAIVVHPGALASALNDTRAGLATTMTAALFSPTTC